MRHNSAATVLSFPGVRYGVKARLLRMLRTEDHRGYQTTEEL